LSTTVTCELRVQPSFLDDVIQRATAQLSTPSQTVPGRRHARILQHLDDPNYLLYVAEWESRKAFDAYRDTAAVPERTDQFQQLPTFRHYQRIALFEHVFATFDIVCVDRVQGPADTHAARRALALHYHRCEARQQAGLVLLVTNERAEDPQELLLVSGWRAPSPDGHPGQLPDHHLLGQLRATGGVVNRFIGRRLLATPDLSPPS
jgi:quinol monooxygenase YgiN